MNNGRLRPLSLPADFQLRTAAFLSDVDTENEDRDEETDWSQHADVSTHQRAGNKLVLPASQRSQSQSVDQNYKNSLLESLIPKL
jgi:hypothetical protein